MSLHLVCETANNVLNQSGTFEDEAGVNLAEMSAGGDFFPGAFGVADAADSDDSEFALRLDSDALNDFHASFSQRLAAESARFLAAWRERPAGIIGAGDCRVCCHDARQ